MSEFRKNIVKIIILLYGSHGIFLHFNSETFTILVQCRTVLFFIQTGVRPYFPRLGRYMQIDSIKDGLNWLAYTDNNPVNKIDPKGLYSIKICYRFLGINFIHAFLLIGNVNDPHGVGNIPADRDVINGERMGGCLTIKNLNCE